jgi:CDP-diacylglycerol--glycerol-3-phosphate 3-phosphatidyltransferase
MNLPNLLTSLRLVLVPVFVVLFEAGNPARAGLAAAVFAVAVATDWLDGYAARRSGQTTRIGKLLDPIADKILIAAALVILVDAGRVASWLAVLLIGRDFVVTGLRFVAATGGQIIAADAGGKVKMGVQTGACLLLIGSDIVPGFPAETIGTLGLWASWPCPLLGGPTVQRPACSKGDRDREKEGGDADRADGMAGGSRLAGVRSAGVGRGAAGAQDALAGAGVSLGAAPRIASLAQSIPNDGRDRPRHAESQLDRGSSRFASRRLGGGGPARRPSELAVDPLRGRGTGADHPPVYFNWPASTGQNAERAWVLTSWRAASGPCRRICRSTRRELHPPRVTALFVSSFWGA